MIQNKETAHNTIRILLLLLVLVPFVLVFAPFFVPIVFAGFVALGIEPLIQRMGLARKSRWQFALILFSILFLVGLVPTIMFLTRIGKALSQISTDNFKDQALVSQFILVFERVKEFLSHTAQRIGFESSFLPDAQTVLEKASPWVIDWTTKFVSELPAFGLALLVFWSSLYLFITQAGHLKYLLKRVQFLPEDELNFLSQTLQQSSQLVLVSSLAIGGIQALFVSFGSLVFGFHEFFLIFTVTFLCSFVPMLGAAPVAFVLALYGFFSGNYGVGVGMLVVTAISGSLDNILRPMFLAKEEGGLHPLISLFGIIGALSVFGILGLVIGPMLMSLLVKMTPYLVQKLLASSHEPK